MNAPESLPDIPEHMRKSVFHIIQTGCPGEPDIFYSHHKQKKLPQLKTSELKNYFDGVRIP